MTKRDWIVIGLWFLVVCAILIFMASVAFGHGVTITNFHQTNDCSENGTFTLEGKTVKHFTPNSWNDPCKQIWCSGVDTSRFKGGHGHATYKDGELIDWGYTSCEGYSLLCGGSCDDESPLIGPCIGDDCDDELDCPDPPCEDVNPCPNPPCDEIPEQKKPVVTSGKPTGRSLFGGETDLGCNAMVGVEICHTWRLNDYTLVGFPTRFKYLQDFYEYLKREVGDDVDFDFMIDGEWESYVESSRFVEMTPHLGVRVGHDMPISVVGRPVRGESVTLGVGTYLVGFPEVPAAYERFSDLLVDGVEYVQWYTPKAVWTIPTHEVDVEIERGMAVVIKTTKEVTFNLTGTAQAPMAQRHNTLTTSWGAIKQER